MKGTSALVLALAGLSAALSGCCIPMMLGAAIYEDHRHKEQHAAFRQENLEREKAGLRPLTWEEWRHRPEPCPEPTAH